MKLPNTPPDRLNDTILSYQKALTKLNDFLDQWNLIEHNKADYHQEEWLDSLTERIEIGSMLRNVRNYLSCHINHLKK
jgi:hypothetical protein